MMLIERDIDGKDLRLIRNLYWDRKAAIRIGDEMSDYVNIKKVSERAVYCHQPCFLYTARKY